MVVSSLKDKKPHVHVVLALLMHLKGEIDKKKQKDGFF